MIVVKPFKAEDFEILRENAIDDTAKDIPLDWLRARAKQYEKCGCAFTGWLGDTRMGCLGIWTVREGVGNMWSIIHKDVKKHVIPSMRAVKEMLRIVEDMYDFTKLRSDSRIGFPQSQRMLEFLGFERQRRTMINGTHYFYRRVLCRQQQQQ